MPALSSVCAAGEKKSRNSPHGRDVILYPAAEAIVKENRVLLVQSEPSMDPAAQERADLYALLAALWLGPDAALLQALAQLGESAAGAGDDDLGASWQALLASVRRCGPEHVEAEFLALFCAAGTPRINPYQCFYVAGWLMDKPLALLRQDLARLGLARKAGATELEDHIGALCESMRVLITRGAPLQVQTDFFGAHLAGWTTRCLHDVAAAPEADAYRAIAAFTEAFLRAEAETLDAQAPPDSPVAMPRSSTQHATTLDA
jgi:TorA maturation chaperone TorD